MLPLLTLNRKAFTIFDYRMHKTLTIFLLVLSFGFSKASEKIEFPSKDGVTIVADLFMDHPKTSPMIVLFHQARSSRGEYSEIAPKLNMLGFNCLVVDLRSGGAMNGVANETFANAKTAMKPTQYSNSYQDIEAAIGYASTYLTEGKLIIWGSSYSSSLVLKYAGDFPNSVNAVLAFSPGEYFSREGKSKEFITTSAKNIVCPVFIASAKNEKSMWWNIYESIPSETKSNFLPESSGNHGSRALWDQYGDSMGYWKAVEEFLKLI